MKNKRIANCDQCLFDGKVYCMAFKKTVCKNCFLDLCHTKHVCNCAVDCTEFIMWLINKIEDKE